MIQFYIYHLVIIKLSSSSSINDQYNQKFQLSIELKISNQVISEQSNILVISYFVTNQNSWTLPNVILSPFLATNVSIPGNSDESSYYVASSPKCSLNAFPQLSCNLGAIPAFQTVNSLNVTLTKQRNLILHGDTQSTIQDQSGNLWSFSPTATASGNLILKNSSSTSQYGILLYYDVMTDTLYFKDSSPQWGYWNSGWTTGVSAPSSYYYYL